MKNLNVSTVIAAIALFIVVGGTATAASGLINGKKIKPGTITAKQIRNKTITPGKLAPATVKALKGSRGPAGPQGLPGAPGLDGAAGPAGPAGSQGATGPTGATGADGVVAPYSTELVNLTLPSGEYTVPLTLNVEPGTYMLSAKANVWSNSASYNYLECTIWTDDTHGVDSGITDGTTQDTVNLAMMAVAEVAAKVELRCVAHEGNGAANHLKLIAVPVQG